MNEDKIFFYVGLCLVGGGLLFNSPFSLFFVIVGNLLIIIFSILTKNWEIAILTFVMLWIQTIRLLLGGL